MISDRGHEPAHILSQGRALADARPRPAGPARVRPLAIPVGRRVTGPIAGVGPGPARSSTLHGDDYP